MYVYRFALPDAEIAFANTYTYMYVYSTLHFRLRLARRMGKIQFRPGAARRADNSLHGRCTLGLLYGRRENSWNYCAFYIKQFTSGASHSYLLTADDILSLRCGQ